MEDFLTKINLVYKNNYINKLEKANQKEQERVKKYLEIFKKEFTEQEIEKRKQQETINELHERIKILENQNKTYKFILDKIPNFIIKLFAGAKKLRGYLDA